MFAGLRPASQVPVVLVREHEPPDPHGPGSG